WCARSRNTTSWGPRGSSLSMASARPRLMTWSPANAVTRRKQSWAPPMSSPPASAWPPAISRAGRAAPSPCSESWDSPSNTSDDQPGKADPRQQKTTEGATLSTPFSAPTLKPPGDDARLDLTDLFVFAAPDNPDRTVLIMNSNPFTKGDGFHPDAVYRFNIDNDEDALADVAFSFTFSPYDNGRQTATACYATGSDAQTREPRGEVLIGATDVGFDASATPVQAGPCRLFVGKRSAPFSAPADGVRPWLIAGQKGDSQWTGTDTFAGASI